ncbi:energy-coupling factor transport system ATP-binding protein [Desulforamulus putei DSM 12395]|uniref:Energy-coupling factor transporter ATP-binding protein EcfA2 n=1 Tax=Desulforamulus putei DSM 12395 TaxID=1121429 RepID=A0A1M4WG93_9FIRM|nr:energy-coupling factor transporter ATPase [Desulforamulus putei]SHE80234.1 energy-coupling factor transport system ATP-binding protein [Desulforamulus putei DSM 12395]
MPGIIDIKNLYVSYAPGTPIQRHALRGISMAVEKGEYRAIIGPQGSGKSTLLQVMAGLIEAEGRVSVCGKDLRHKKNRDGLWRQVGIIFQYPERQLFEDTVFNDIAYGPRNMGLSEDEVRRRVKAALEAVNLDEEVYCLSPFKLSGGQKRRAAIAGILAMEPEVLLLDEPTAGLDPRGKRQLMDLFSNLCRKKQVTLVLVTHDMEEVAHRADTVTVLYRGRIAMGGTPKEIFARCKELESIGLFVPFAAQLATSLQAKGLPVRNMTTLPEAEQEVARLLKGRA